MEIRINRHRRLHLHPPGLETVRHGIAIECKRIFRTNVSLQDPGLCIHGWILDETGICQLHGAFAITEHVCVGIVIHFNTIEMYPVSMGDVGQVARIERSTCIIPEVEDLTGEPGLSDRQHLVGRSSLFQETLFVCARRSIEYMNELLTMPSSCNMFSTNPKFAERACCLNGTDSQCITDCRRAIRGIFAAGSAAHQRKVLIINDVRSSDARRDFRVQRT